MKYTGIYKYIKFYINFVSQHIFNSLFLKKTIKIIIYFLLFYNILLFKTVNKIKLYLKSINSVICVFLGRPTQ